MTIATEQRPTAAALAIPVRAIDVEGHDPRSSYVEIYWLPVIGPTATWLYRLIARDWEDGGADLICLDVARAGARVGVGGTGRHCPAIKALDRLTRFGLGWWGNDGILNLKRNLPAAPERARRRLEAVGS